MIPGCIETVKDRSIIRVCRHDTRRAQFEGISDHAKERIILAFPVQSPGCTKYLVATVLAIHLSKHHEFDVSWIPSVGVYEIVYLVWSKSKAPFLVREYQSVFGTLWKINE